MPQANYHPLVRYVVYAAWVEDTLRASEQPRQPVSTENFAVGWREFVERI